MAWRGYVKGNGSLTMPAQSGGHNTNQSISI